MGYTRYYTKVFFVNTSPLYMLKYPLIAGLLGEVFTLYIYRQLKNVGKGIATHADLNRT